MEKQKIKGSSLGIICFLFIFTFLTYFFSSPGESHYDYFGRLALAMTQGKLYLETNPPWLNELIPVDGKYYVVYPPMPALLMLPFTFLFEQKSFQTFFSIVLGALNVTLVYILFHYKLKFARHTSLIITLFFGFGTNHWYLASVGSAWFIAHIVALLFLLLALIETFGSKKFLLIGFLIGCSFWARTTVLFTVPFFYLYFYKSFWPINKNNLLNFFLLNIGITVMILIDGYYNYIRFGNFSPFAPYNLIPGLENDAMFKDGFMSLSFIPRHIEAIFLKIPWPSSEFPYLTPSLYATALWFTSPLLIYILNFKKTLLALASWVGVLLPLVVIMMWAGVGYAQFGYRFAQDFMPFLLILVATGIGKRPSLLVYALLLLSIMVNAWGTIMVNKFDIWNMG